MRKMIKFLNALVAGSLLLGFFVSAAEKRMKDAGQEKAGKQKKHHPLGFYEMYLKRPLDFAAAFLGLLFLLPVLLILTVLVRVRLGKPVIFRQERPGKDGKIFTLYKFRTMTDERDEKGEFLPDEIRLTKFGKKLRSTSLDELPELFNILKGEMSLVGPRPLLVEYLTRYNERQARRHEVRPGLTGLAQVSGRNSLTWEEKFEEDVKYVDHITFLADMRILFRTAAVVFQKKGISSGTSATMEVFMGNEDGGTDKT